MAKDNAQCTIHNAQRKYIDVDKFAEKICNFQQIDEDAANKMIFLLRTFPTADVVEVCRCKECANGYNKTNIKVVCKIWGRVMLPEDYCSYGAKMDGGKAE